MNGACLKQYHKKMWMLMKALCCTAMNAEKNHYSVGWLMTKPCGRCLCLTNYGQWSPQKANYLHPKTTKQHDWLVWIFDSGNNTSSMETAWTEKPNELSSMNQQLTLWQLIAWTCTYQWRNLLVLSMRMLGADKKRAAIAALFYLNVWSDYQIFTRFSGAMYILSPSFTPNAV